MSKKLDDFPDDLPENIRLFLRKGRWALELENPKTRQMEIYLFPEYVTKEEATDIINRAVDLRRKN